MNLQSVGCVEVGNNFYEVMVNSDKELYFMHHEDYDNTPIHISDFFNSHCIDVDHVKQVLEELHVIVQKL